MSITLTVEQIIDLANFAGLALSKSCKPDADELETEITVIACPDPDVAGGYFSKIVNFRHIAYYSEYPEEGCAGLGPEIGATHD